MQETSSMTDDGLAQEAPKPVDTTVVLVVYALMLAVVDKWRARESGVGHRYNAAFS